MHWTRIALIVALAAATLVGVYSLPPHAEPGVISTIACYVALSNDITPLLSSGAPDVAASSPECLAQAALDDSRHRDGGADADVTMRSR